MSTTDNRNDPRLTKGIDETPAPQAAMYLVLSEEERAKGYTRPYRDTYRHVGDYPRYQLRPLNEEEQKRFAGCEYIVFEEYPEGEAIVGRYWTQKMLDYKACGTTTTMNHKIAETYARDPQFYGATYCVACRMHRPLEEFVWLDGTQVGS